MESVNSSQYFRLPVATRGLEILIDFELKIEASKMEPLVRLKEIIERNYEDPVEASVQPTENSNFLNVEGRKREGSEDELDILLFVDDEGEQENEI